MNVTEPGRVWAPDHPGAGGTAASSGRAPTRILAAPGRAGGSIGLAGRLLTDWSRMRNTCTRCTISQALVVQDDPTNAYLLVRLFRRWGYEVVEVVSDAEQAWERLSQGHGPRVVVLDHAMAGDTAFDLCRRIQRRGWAADVHVVLLGGHADEVSRARARAAGAGAVVRKPFALPELAGALPSLP
jgi:CheY-like chemotaxis protein